MGSYSQERRASVLSKLLPPHNGAVTEVSQEEGICTATLYNWLKSVKKRGLPVPGSGKKTADEWSGEAKLAVVLEVASLNAEELSRYCRRKGLYPEQIARWKQACIDGAKAQPEQDRQASDRFKDLKKRHRMLEKELRRKDKALAESAALLVLHALRALALFLPLMPIALAVRGSWLQIAAVFSLLLFIVGDFAPLIMDQPYPSTRWLLARTALGAVEALLLGAAAARLIGRIRGVGDDPL